MPRRNEGSFDRYVSYTEGSYKAPSQSYGLSQKSMIQSPDWYRNSPSDSVVKEDTSIRGVSRYPIAPAQATQQKTYHTASAGIATEKTMEYQPAHLTPHVGDRETQTTVNAHQVPTGRESMYRAQHCPSNNSQSGEQLRSSDHGQTHTVNPSDYGAESLLIPTAYELRTPTWAVPTEPSAAPVGHHPRDHGPSTSSITEQSYYLGPSFDLGFNDTFNPSNFQEFTNPAMPMVPQGSQSSFFHDVTHDCLQASRLQSSYSVHLSLSATQVRMQSGTTSFEPLPPRGRRSFLQAMEHATAMAMPFTHQHVQQEHGSSSRPSTDTVERVEESSNIAPSHNHTRPTPVIHTEQEELLRAAQRYRRLHSRLPPKPARVKHFTTLQANDQCHDEECPICQDPYNDNDHTAIRLQHVLCDHVFGLKCIQEWINSGMQNAHRCPSCRQSIVGALSQTTAPPRRQSPAGSNRRTQRVSIVAASRPQDAHDARATYSEEPGSGDVDRRATLQSAVSLLDQRIAGSSPRLESVQNANRVGRRPRTARSTIHEQVPNFLRSQDLSWQSSTGAAHLTVPAPTTAAVPGQQDRMGLRYALAAQRQEIAIFDDAAARETANPGSLNETQATNLAAQI